MKVNDLLAVMKEFTVVTLWGLIFQFCFNEAFSISIHLCGEELLCNIIEDEYCCHFPDFHCCSYDRFVKSVSNTSSEDNYGSFTKTGLRSALALLILSSGMFLICFCIIKFCKQHAMRPMLRGGMSPQGTLAEYRRRNVRFSGNILSRPSRSRLIISVSSTRTAVADEPPTYNEVISTDTGCNTPTEKPPEYSSLITNQSDVD